MLPGFGVDVFWRRLAACAAAVTIAVSAFGCDEPPEAPQSEVEVEQERETLDERVDETRGEAQERVEAADEDIPERDAGGEDSDSDE